jgi:glycosyltransferase involved in cell wall biosynthesis
VKEIQPLVLNPALCHQLGRAAAKTVTSMFSPKVVARKLENFYRSGIQ